MFTSIHLSIPDTCLAFHLRRKNVSQSVSFFFLSVPFSLQIFNAPFPGEKLRFLLKNNASIHTFSSSSAEMTANIQRCVCTGVITTTSAATVMLLLVATFFPGENKEGNNMPLYIFCLPLYSRVFISFPGDRTKTRSRRKKMVYVKCWRSCFIKISGANAADSVEKMCGDGKVAIRKTGKGS